MYKNKIVLYFLFVLIAGICSNYASDANRIYFVNYPDNLGIVIPMQLNDSVIANMTFDTGCRLGHFDLDSSLLAAHPSCLTLNGLPKIKKKGSSWKLLTIPSLYYDSPQTVTIGNFNLTYNGVEIYDYKGYYRTNTDGMFNIPEHDTSHVWELNFEHNYLEIHSTNGFEMPQDCFLLPLEKSKDNPYPFNVTIPMQIRSSNGDTLTINRTYMVDMAMVWDIALIAPADELEFFNKRGEEAVWLPAPDGYKCRYTVEAVLFDHFIVDSLRIYTFDYSYNTRIRYLIGQNFLKRFNVFFDLKNSQLGLQPINNFQRIVNPNIRRFHYAKSLTSEGKQVLTKVADSPSNYYYTAGLREGDEIVNINGLPAQRISRKQALEISKKDTIIFDIIRLGEQIKITVPIDKNEERGD